MAAFGSAKLDADVAQTGPIEGPNEFSKGLRSGMLGAGSQLQSFAGGAGAAMGFDDFAANRMRDAAALQEQANAVGPRVGSYKDVGGLRDALDYGAGLFGQAVPSIGLGVGAGALTAATGGGALAALGAGALTQLPLEAGDVLQRQQLDPTARMRGAGENFANALGSGAVSAIGQSIVPAALGGKLIGKSVGGAIQGAERGALRSIATDAGIEGLSEAGGELAKQQGVQVGARPDWGAALEAGVGGAVVGGPLGGVGHIADRAHAIPSETFDGMRDLARRGTDALGRAAGGAKDAAAGALGGAKTAAGDARTAAGDAASGAGDWFEGKDFKGAAGAAGQVVKDFAGKIKDAVTPKQTDEDVLGAEGLSPEELAEAGNPATMRERATELLNTGEKKAVEAGKRVGAFLKEKANLSDEDQAKVDSLIKGTADATTRAWAKTKTQAAKAGDRFMGTVDSVGKVLGEAKKGFVAERDRRKAAKTGGEQDQYPDGSWESVNAEINAAIDEAKRDPSLGKPKGKLKLSEDYTGIREEIARDVMQYIPEELHSNPKAIAKVGEVVRGYIEALKAGDYDTTEKAAKGMQKLFGDDTDTIIGNIYDKIATNDPEATARFIDGKAKAQKVVLKERTFRDTVTKLIPKNFAGNADDLIDGMVDWASGNGKISNIPELAAEKHAQVRQQLQTVFGNNTERALDALERHVGEMTPTTLNETIGAPETGTTNEFYGAGRGNKGGGKMQLLESPEAHATRMPDSKFGGAASQLMKKLKERFPDRDIKFVSLADAAEELGWSEGRVAAALHSKGIDPADADKYGFVASNRIDDPTKLTDVQVQDMKLDTDKYPNSPSRFQIGDDIFDAVRVAKHFLKNSKDLGTESSSVRLARAFNEGFAQLQTRSLEEAQNRLDAAKAEGNDVGAKAIQMQIDMIKEKSTAASLPDSIVIGTNAGEKMTVGAARKLDPRTSDDVAADVKRADFNTKLDKLRTAYAAEKDPEQKANIKARAQALIEANLDEKAQEILGYDSVDEELARVTGELDRFNLMKDSRYKQTKSYQELADRVESLRKQRDAGIGFSDRVQAVLGTREEIDPATGNIHHLAAVGDVEREATTTGKEGTYKGTIKFNEDGTPRVEQQAPRTHEEGEAQIAKVQAFANKLRATGKAPAINGAKRIEGLLKNLDLLEKGDRQRLMMMVGDKKMSDVGDTLGELAAKYRSVLTVSGDPTVPKTGAFAGEKTQPVNTRPVPPEPDMVKSGKKAREGYDKGKPTEMLGEALGTHRDDLINPVERINNALQGKSADGEGPNRPKARAAKKAALIKAASSSDPALLAEIKTTENAVGLQNSIKALNSELAHDDIAGALAGLNISMEDALIKGFTDLNQMEAVKKGLAGIERGRESINADPDLTDGERAALLNQLDNMQHRFEASLRSWEAGRTQTEANKATLDILNEVPEGATPADFTKIGKPLGDVLDVVAPHMTELQQIVARAVKKLAGHVGVFKDNLSEGMMGIYGYSPDFEAIGIAKVNNATAAQTLLHEGVHASTMIALEKDKTLAGIAHTLMQHVVSADRALAAEYGLTNEHEFMAEALSNPAFQAQLKKIAANGLIDSHLAKYTAWDAFVDLVRKALGLAEGDRNALVQALELGGVVMRKQHETTTVGTSPHGALMRQGADGSYALASTVKAMNERLDTLVKDPDVSYNMQRTNPKSGPSAGDRADAEAIIRKSLGKSVAGEWAKLPHAGEFEEDVMGDVIRLSIYGLNPKSTAYHESLHAFFAQMRRAGGDAYQVNRVLEKAASQPAVKRWLENHFKNEPAVLQQIRTDAEERAAYMYQMWATEPSFKALLNPQATSIFGKVAEFFRSVLGIWSNDQRALHIMEHFQSGEYAKNIGKPNTALLLGSGTNRAVEQFKVMAQPLGKLGDAVFGAGSARLRDTDVAALNQIADAIKPTLSGSENTDTGFLAAARTEFTSRLNAFGEKLTGLSKEQVNEVLVQLQTEGKTMASTPEARLAAREVLKTLQETGAYLRKTGVDFGNLGPDYFPRVWDANTIARKQKQFIAMVEKYRAQGKYSGDPMDLLRTLVANDGNEFDVDTRTPGFQQGKHRQLDMFDAADIEPFMSKDLYQTMSSYISQATRRAEWARRFGPEGKGLTDMLNEATEQGATKEQIAMTEKYLKGITGTLGDGINPEARRLMGNAIIYQNIRLLPLAIFSSVVDPMGIALRGGTMSDAFTAFKRGMREIPRNFKKYDPNARDTMEKLAETLGVIENASLMHSLGALYSQGMAGSTGRKINDTFFRFNLMEQYNRSMRVAATEAALKFIDTHASHPTKDSKRWMDELNLKPSDVQRDANGRVKLTVADGLTPAEAHVMRDAVNKWVDGAILRPDQADKPIWFNDPHWALVSHLKQFVYAFQHTIINRVVREAKEGNYKPAAILGSYVPVMIAADFLKGFIQGGGEQPAWKKDWGAMDYAWSGVQRAGLFGVGQFGVDAATDIHRGGIGFGALTGPTIDQITDGAQVVGGQKRFEPWALDSLPANALYKNLNTGE